MTLHRYLIRFTTRKVVENKNSSGEPYSQEDLENYAKRCDRLFEQEVRAFSATDAIAQLTAVEGGSMGQPPYLFAIEPLPDVSAATTPLPFTVEIGSLGREEAMCAVCGKVATQWRKDTPVCSNSDCVAKAAFGGK